MAVASPYLPRHLDKPSASTRKGIYQKLRRYFWASMVAVSTPDICFIPIGVNIDISRHVVTRWGPNSYQACFHQIKSISIPDIKHGYFFLKMSPVNYYFFFFAHFCFPASRQAVVTDVIPSPRFLSSIFIAHRVQQSHCSSIVHRVLLTHALAFSASQLVHKKKSQRIYTNMHSAGLEVTKLTDTRLEDNLIRHRGDRSNRSTV